MRRLLILSLAVVCVGCAAPHSSGALWAQQNLDQERVAFQKSDAQRADIARAFEVSLADQSLVGERQRIAAALQTCPDPRQALAVSPGDRVRDGIRVRAQADTARTTQVANVALADWYMRRASATGDKRYCDQAAAALDGATAATGSTPDLISSLPVSLVTREKTPPTAQLTTDPATVTLSQYALGYLDTVQAAAPLPQYLAVVYGGTLVEPPDAPASLDAERAAAVVDSLAPLHPESEPDALYAALRGAVP